MLDTLRRGSRSFLVYIFFAIIIVVFVFAFGPSSGGCRSSARQNHAAVVNGETIPVSSYYGLARQWEQSYGVRVEENQVLAGIAVDKLIQEWLLAQEAASRGIVVSDSEVEKEILSQPGLSDARNFEELEKRVQRAQGTLYVEYEQYVRRQMTAKKMRGLVYGAAVVSEDEVKSEYVRKNEKIDLELVRFSPDYFQTQIQEIPSEKAVDEFIKTAGSRLEEAYKARTARYNKPKRVKARHILIKVEKKASDAEVARAQQKIIGVRQKVVAGADFAVLAKETSDDGATKELGGDLGVLASGTAGPAFEKVAFSLKPGEISQPVRTGDGFHLIQVQEVFPAESKSLKDVQNELAQEILREDSAKAMAKAKAEETWASVRAGKKLEELWPPEPAKKPDEAGSNAPPRASRGKPALEKTGPFEFPEKNVPSIGVDSSLVRVLAALNETNPLVDRVFEVNGEYYVIRLLSRSHPDLKEYETQRDELFERARQRKAEGRLGTFLKSLESKAQIEKNKVLFPEGEGVVVGNGPADG